MAAAPPQGAYDKVIKNRNEKKINHWIINRQTKMLTNRPTSPLTILTLIIANLKAFVFIILLNISFESFYLKGVKIQQVETLTE
jgi:hypothetical protein